MKEIILGVAVFGWSLMLIKTFIANRRFLVYGSRDGTNHLRVLIIWIAIMGSVGIWAHYTEPDVPLIAGIIVFASVGALVAGVMTFLSSDGMDFEGIIIAVLGGISIFLYGICHSFLKEWTVVLTFVAWVYVLVQRLRLSIRYYRTYLYLKNNPNEKLVPDTDSRDEGTRDFINELASITAERITLRRALDYGFR